MRDLEEFNRCYRNGVERMIGITQDPLFGPLIAFGLGGIHVEIVNDVCFRVTPISDRDAGDRVRSIRGYRLLQGLILVLPHSRRRINRGKTEPEKFFRFRCAPAMQLLAKP
ncbi:MAG TPA: acetate--CoA ligase family protein [Candidatus Saccharimonadales bacterium]|nr:acetate--CoA ligase family protein [Candidatus Saccharimonadales bacterium]